MRRLADLLLLQVHGPLTLRRAASAAQSLAESVRHQLEEKRNHLRRERKEIVRRTQLSYDAVALYLDVSRWVSFLPCSRVLSLRDLTLCMIRTDGNSARPGYVRRSLFVDRASAQPTCSRSRAQIGAPTTAVRMDPPALDKRKLPAESPYFCAQWPSTSCLRRVES